MQLAVARAVKSAMEDVRRTAMVMSEAPAQRPPRVPLAVRVDDPANVFSNEEPIEAEVTESVPPPSDTMAESLATSAPGAPQDSALPPLPPDSVSMVPPLFASLIIKSAARALVSARHTGAPFLLVSQPLATSV
jgi:hypothetical protein